MQDEQLEAGFVDRATGRLAPRSITGYRRDLARFRRDLQAQGDWPGWQALQAHQVQLAFAHYQAAQMSLATQQRLATSLRQFYRDLIAQDLVKTSPLVGFKLRTGSASAAAPAVGTYADLQTLAAAARATAPLDEATILTLLVQTGLRPREVTAITAEQFDWSLDLLLVPARSGRARYLPVDQAVHQMIQAYQRQRPQTAAGPLFLNRRGAPISTDWVAQAIRHVSHGHLTPVKIRHLVIDHWVTTVGVTRAAQLAGYRRLSALASYQTRTTPNLRQNYQKYFYGGDHQ